MKKTIVIMIDAFRRDYLDKEHTPFLYDLAKKFRFGKLEQPFGFKSTEGFYTGSPPTNFNQFTYYGYGGKVKKFPFKLLKIFPGISKYYLINLFNYYKGDHIFFPQINMNYFKYFDLYQKKHFYQRSNINNIFSIFNKNKIKYLFYDFPLIIENGKSRLHYTLKNNDEAHTNKFLKLLNKKHLFYYVHLGDLDGIGHKYGPNSTEIKKYLKKQDNLVKKILSNFDLEKDNLIIWSDHGMVQIKNLFNLESKLPKFGEGYLYFLESTMARFWFFNEIKRKEVLSILKKCKEGRLISKSEKDKLGITSKNNFYGDEVFLMKSGILLFPNFFNKSPVRGMHGYDLSDKNEKAFFIINKKTKKSAKTEDLFPTLLELMEIKSPQDIKGKSLL